jgi:hypothetical protein
MLFGGAFPDRQVAREPENPRSRSPTLCRRADRPFPLAEWGGVADPIASIRETSRILV